LSIFSCLSCSGSSKVAATVFPVFISPLQCLFPLPPRPPAFLAADSSRRTRRKRSFVSRERRIDSLRRLEMECRGGCGAEDD
jgi:hypothetical protein